MGYVLRKPQDLVNPTLPGGVYGVFITAGIGVYWFFDGIRVRFLLFIADGGKYGLDSITRITYKGATIPVSDFKFHRGTITKQITPFAITSIDVATNKIGIAAHPFANGDQIRLRSRTGLLPSPLSTDVKVFVVNKSVNDFQVSYTAGGAVIDLTNAGSGAMYAWKADAGYDDPEQGLPTICTGITDTTFSGISYAEGYLPANYNTNQEPAWEDFRVEGFGRRLMDYDADGNEVGIVSNGSPLLLNPALIDADVIINEMKRPLSRINWISWYQFRQDSNTKVWQRPDFTESGTGWIANYFTYAGAGVPVIGSGTLALTKREAEINLSWANNESPTNVTGSFYAVYEGQIIPKYTENYTLTVQRDNGARLYVDGALVINQWTTTTGTNTGNVNLTANVPVTFRLEFFDAGRPAVIQLKWQSASQAIEIIPKESVYDPDLQIPRYEFSGAFTAVEASEVHERIMSRCPGYDWTDRNGKITYLPPNRPITFDFVFDAEDSDAECTFISETFEKTRRHRRDRKNFSLYSFRERNLTGFPEGFVEENRPRLRELGGGVPDNDAPVNLMVLNRGQAKRVADSDFKLGTDPEYTLSLDAPKKSGVVTKNTYVHVRNWTAGDNRVEDAICLVTSVERQGKSLSFGLLPIEYPFYEDEVAEESK